MRTHLLRRRAPWIGIPRPAPGRANGRPVEIGVFDGMLRVPRHHVDAITIGPGAEGDGCLILCRSKADPNNPGWYYAHRKAGEKIVAAGLRRVQNWCTVRDPADPAWAKVYGGTGAPPVVDSQWYPGPDGQLSARRAYFDAGANGSGDNSNLRFAIADFGRARRAGSIWLKSATGNTETVLLWVGGATSGAAYILNVDNTWRRYALVDGPHSGLFQPRISLRTGFGVGSGKADILIATDPEHCPMLEVGIPSSQTAPSENIAPDVVYNAGVAGVAILAHENPLTVDANGVVIDIGTRVPLPGGGLITPGAATLEAGTSDFTTNWAVIGSATATPGKKLGVYNADDVTFSGLSDDGYSAFISSVAQDEKLSMRLLVAKSQGKIRFGFYNSQNAGRRAVFDTDTGQFVSWDSTGDPDDGLVITDCSNFWTVLLRTRATSGNQTYQAQFFRRPGDGAGTMTIAAEPYRGWVSPYVGMQATTAAASRGSDLAPMRWRPGAGWSPGRRLVAHMVLDTSLALLEGTLLGGVDQAGLQQASLVRVVWDAAAGEYRVQVSDGTTTRVVPIAVPQAPEVHVQVDAGPAGLRVAVDGTEWADSSANFDFSWVNKIHRQQLPDGTDPWPLPFNIRPESWA